MKLDDESLQKVYAWVDEVPLSRPKRNMARDFSDGLLTAEIVAYYYPKLVQLHNYTSASSSQQKMYNWNTLNHKVFRKLHFQVQKSLLEDVVSAHPGAIEELLTKLQKKIATYKPKESTPTDSVAGRDAARGPSPVQSRNSPLKPHSQASPKRTKIPSPNRVRNDDTKDSQWQYDRDHGALLVEKETILQEQRETIQILELKIQKLEQLVRLKDGKIQALVAKIQSGERQ